MSSQQILLTLLFSCFAGNVNSLSKRGEPPQLLKIADFPECKFEISRYCEAKKSNNYELLTCLHNKITPQTKFSKECQHLIWQSKSNLTRAVSFFVNGISAQSCDGDINDIADCRHEREEEGPIIPCLLEFKNQVKNPTCKKYLDFLKPLIFSDFRLTYKLVDRCSDDIEKFLCGRINADVDANDQGSTIDCLAESLESLKAPCKNEILKISELQSEDWNDDRPLYLACREDRDRLCPHVQSGKGLVYECLFKNKMNAEMSKKCQEKLRLRQNLQNRDYSVNYRFASTCKADIELHDCDAQNARTDEHVHTKLSRVILCLEDARISGKKVGVECIEEVKTIRRSLLEDHKINPEVLALCTKEIKRCEEEKEHQPYVIHCLMKMARTRATATMNAGMSSFCSDAVENLLLEVDVGEDLDVDPALMLDCNKEINQKCRDSQKDRGSVMQCLTIQANRENALSGRCLSRVMEIQFFLSRNFKISRRAVSLCRKDAKDVCSTDLDDSTSSDEPHLISCLYRNRLKVASKCLDELNKLMIGRARSVDLPPKIQESCMGDLVMLCPKKIERDEEMFCLEDNYDALSRDCRAKVLEELEREEELPTLSRMFVESCEEFWKTQCSPDQDPSDEETDDDSASVMKCLIGKKNHPDMPKKCRAGVEHHQLMSMEDVNLSLVFGRACESDVASACPNVVLKLDVVRCLSEFVYNDSMLNVEQRISKKCRKQLSFELLQIGENIKLNKELSRSCQSDRERFCDHVSEEGGQVLECLRSHQQDLKKKCRELLFERERLEGVDASIDYALMSKCKRMIRKYCKDRPGDIFQCLKENRNEIDFADQCLAIIVDRMRLKSRDIRLNPALYRNCSKDIEKHCQKELESAQKNTVDAEGSVIYCLRKVFVHKIRGNYLTSSCTTHISELIKDSAVDYIQDIALVKACRPLIRGRCLKEAERHRMDEDGSEVEECLREALLASSEVREKHLGCFTEVLRRMSESKVDIQIDPLLNRQCAVEAKTICGEVNRGEGRVMSCLLSAVEDPSLRMDTGCRKALKERIELWSLSVKLAPSQDLGELLEHVHSSPCRFYVLIFFSTLITTMFFVGLYCGRITKRQRIQKMR